jgi:hypothetical protein
LRALRSDLINPAIAVHRGRVAKRTGDWAPRRISQRGRCGALRTRSAARHGRAQRTPSLIDSPPDFREAMIKAGSRRSERRCGVPAPRLRSWRRRYAFERPKYNSYVHRCSWRCLLHVDSSRIAPCRVCANSGHLPTVRRIDQNRLQADDSKDGIAGIRGPSRFFLSTVSDETLPCRDQLPGDGIQESRRPS